MLIKKTWSGERTHWDQLRPPKKFWGATWDTLQPHYSNRLCHSLTAIGNYSRWLAPPVRASPGRRGRVYTRDWDWHLLAEDLRTGQWPIILKDVELSPTTIPKQELL